MPPRQQAASLWRQWERLSVFGVRAKDKRYSANEALAAWLFLLVFLFLLHQFSSSNPTDPSEASDKLSFATESSFWEGRHLIFTVSPGRAGSKHLCNVIDIADDTISKHEPDPKMNDDVLQSVLLQGHRAESFSERTVAKLGAIREDLEGTAPDVTYAETSHMFIKTYADVVLHHLGEVSNITIVVLNRPLRDVVWSQVRLGWFTPKHSGRDVWYYDVADLHESERMVSLTSNFTSTVDKIIAYNADVRQRAVELRRQVRAQQAKGRWQNVRVVDIRLNELSSPASITAFLARIGLREDKQRLQIIAEQDSNSRREKKDRVHTDITQAKVDSRIDYFANKLPMLQST